MELKSPLTIHLTLLWDCLKYQIWFYVLSLFASLLGPYTLVKNIFFSLLMSLHHIERKNCPRSTNEQK